MIRAFLAVNLSVSVLRRINDVQRALRERCAEHGWDITWVAPPNLHVVVRYLGEVGEALPAPLGDAVTPEIRRLAPFPLRAHGVHIEEGGRGPKVVVGLEDAEGGLPLLRAALSPILEEVGFKPETGEAPAHVVVGRVRHEGQIPLAELASAAAEADFGESIVTDLVAYRSDAVAPRSEFRDIFRVRLTGWRAPRAEAAAVNPAAEEEAPAEPSESNAEQDTGEGTPPEQED